MLPTTCVYCGDEEVGVTVNKNGGAKKQSNKKKTTKKQTNQ